MKFVALIEKDMNGSYRQLKSRSWKRSRTYFDPEAIHIMVPGETEENLINVLKVMRSLTMRNINKVLIIPYLLWMVLFIIVPVILLVYFSFTDLNGHFSLTNYEQILSMKYLK